MKIDEIKNFRQLNSITAGHPNMDTLKELKQQQVLLAKV